MSYLHDVSVDILVQDFRILWFFMQDLSSRRMTILKIRGEKELLLL